MSTPTYRFDRALRERLSRHLDAFDRNAIPATGLREAAVAIVVGPAETPDHAAFLITRRPGRMRRHAGQWALPGGRLDEGEDAVGGALRELAEELGLELDRAAVIGLLDDFATRSGFVITPVVMWADRLDRLEPDPGEVEALYRVPLGDLELPGMPHLDPIPESDRPVLSLTIPWLDTQVFAPTAAMLFQLSEVAVHGRDTRVADYEQPVFAWS